MGDLGKFVGDLYDGAGDVVDKGKEILGTGIDKGTDVLGSGLEKVGADEWADKVEDWGDETASSLGAEVGEQQLGQTEEADELIHGRPEKISAAVKNLRDFQKAFDLVGGGMKKLDSGHWKGEAADAFRAKFQTLPTDWLRAADAFEDAAKALETFAGVVTSAQAKAGEAIALYKEGKQDYETAAAAFKEKAEAYNAVRNTDHPLPHPGTFSDPGAAKRRHAQEILQRARRARDDAGEAAKGAITAAMAHAPKEPTGMDRAKQELFDYGVGQGMELAHFGGGVIKGTAGLVNFVRSVNPQDPYNLTHPAEYYKGVNMTLAGLTSTVANPDRALKNAWDAAKGDPSEFLGRLVPELIGTKGGGLIKGGLRAGMKDLAERPKSPNRRGHEDNPDSHGQQCSKVKCAGDPIDVATGRMLLPQTDIVLPGSLPLVFERVFDSSHRAGRWFGTGWSSTVDQRLEIDAEGVVFSCNEGSLLAYPHPAPGVPVMPTHGRRWPLDRVADGYTVTDPETGQVRHFVDQPTGELALLAQIDDRNGRWIAFEHDEAGAPTSIVHHGGYHLKLTTAEGRVTTLHLAGAGPDGTDQEILRYGYTDGHLTTVTNSSGKPMRFDCDELGRITAWTDTNGSRYEYVYDEHDRCIYQAGTNGHLEARFTWDGTDPETGLRMTSMTDGMGHTTQYVINDRAQVVAEIDPLGAVTRFEHDRYDRLLSVTDPLGHVIQATYDEHGRLISVVRPDGRETTAEYNALGLPVRVKGADGTITRQTYDERGNRTSVTDSAGLTSRFAYDEAGNLTLVTKPLGHTIRVVCDRIGLPSAVADPLGAVTRYERDASGCPTTITDPTGATIHLEWTVEGRLSRRTAPDGASESWTYDGEGNCTSHTNPTGAVRQFEYTHFDLLAARTDADGVRHEFEHDTALRLTKVINAQGLTWSYRYDAAGRLSSETDFDNRSLTYTRDAMGRLVSRTNALGQMVRLERNELGQVVRKDAAGEVTTYAYDLTDQVAQATGPSGNTLTVLRDRFGRVREEAIDGRVMAYWYDELGRRTGRRTPSGASTTWSYDAAGRRTGMLASGWAIDFAYDEAGREVTRHIGETLTLEHTFDTLGRLTTQAMARVDGSLVQQRAYTYRADGHLLSTLDHLSGSRRFDLDAIGRVTAVHAANWTETYAYDEANNQIQATWPPDHPGQEAVGARTYVGTRITRAGDVRYEHDNLGRITLRQKTRLSRKPDTWRYEWDAEDRLTSVVTPEGTRWRYTYDPLGRRTAKLRLAEEGETVVERVVFTWDETALCEQTTTSTELPHPVTLTWDHQGLQPLAQRERIAAADAPQEEIDSRFFAIVTDLTGTPSELVDGEGRIAWRTRSTLWGMTTWAANSTTYTPLRFPGQYYDPETGLHYNYFRHYDPATARYLTSDPLGLEPSPNPVAYVLNPHAWVDPLGLAPCPPRIKDGGWDLRNHNPLDIVPGDAEMRVLTPDANGGAQKGVEYKWKDPETGNTARLRVHDKDGTAPAGSNAANGDVYRVVIGGKYQDEAGVLYHRQVHNPNSPHYDPDAANGTHIPWPSQYPLPY
ncbi:polymorphic toxin type 30 domain-containing protein (plasmid) [Streptomyces sp. NBC_01201]|uniref:Polymorphic toxin type 30 domain-containing protein n=1 Tax=Streptomyces glycanivorans TaxID=3033808 RepID=A0ABY9JNN5_9ACTN|nr:MULTISPECIES: polymorphic toxin type 30 domain-containing protein [unclassified Streptomyces]WLQ69218.1 polymorphic toxin type 30 domain-containing protein [Streptomyces sp. Alt3]WSR53407.1 polymorphic toxin type 30 domain-containing protein [Streptomyces sp. NBC_01201]